jgi:hypothetical protein
MRVGQVKGRVFAQIVAGAVCQHGLAIGILYGPISQGGGGILRGVQKVDALKHFVAVLEIKESDILPVCSLPPARAALCRNPGRFPVHHTKRDFPDRHPASMVLPIDLIVRESCGANR